MSGAGMSRARKTRPQINEQAWEIFLARWIGHQSCADLAGRYRTSPEAIRCIVESMLAACREHKPLRDWVNMRMCAQAGCGTYVYPYNTHCDRHGGKRSSEPRPTQVVLL
jgi:hypothetical protein